MLDEENRTNETSEGGMEADYLATIKQLKENSVPREKFEQMKAENKRLLEVVVNGQPAEQQAPAKQKVDIDELRKRVFKEDQTNLDYVTNALALRNALIENGERDPFLPCGEKTIPTDADIATAERAAKIFQECVDYAEGDSEVFTNELMRRTVDTAPRKK